MSARLASSCSMKGISAVDIETICLGETSIRSTSDGRHEVDLAGGAVGGAAGADAHAGALGRAAHQHALVGEGPVRGQLGVGLGDDVLLFLVCGQVDDLVGDHALRHPTVRGLDEAVLVYTPIGRQVADKADVRAFGRLDGAHAAVVGAVDVTDLEPGPLPGQATGPMAESRRLWVRPDSGLVWSMNCESWLVPKNSFMAATTGRMLISVWGVIASTSWVVMRSRTTRSIRERPDTDLVLDQLAHRAHTPVGEVVLVVEAVTRLALGQVEKVGACGQDLALGQHGLARHRAVQFDPEEGLELADLGAELAVELVAADPRQVIALGVEEGVLEIGPGRFHRGRLARTGTLVDLQEGSLLGRRHLLLALGVPLRFEELEVAHETLEERLIGIAEGAQQREKGQAPLAGHPGAGTDVLARLGFDVELDPLAAVGVHRAGHDRLGVAAGLEDDPGRTDELRYDHPLGAVDNERAPVRHHGEIAHEDRLFFDLAGVGVLELRPHEDGRGIGHVLFLALLHRKLRAVGAGPGRSGRTPG